MSVRPKDDDWKECSEIHYNELMTRRMRLRNMSRPEHRANIAHVRYMVFHVIVLFQGEP